VLWPYLMSLLLVGGCRCDGDAPAAPPAVRAIEVRDAAGATYVRIVPGRPCRATVEGFELLVGTQPLVAQHGAARWTAETAGNGTTFLKDGAPVARFYARQLFDAEGLTLLRVLDDGSIANRASAIVRRATPSSTGDSVAIGASTVTGTTDVVLAAVLTAPEATPDVRALVACFLLSAGAP
jgi:hypothetical protein